MIKNIFFAFVGVIFSITSFGQGCSDAGFCTMGAMKPNQIYNKKAAVTLRSVELTQYAATAPFKTKQGEPFTDRFLSYIADINIGVGRRFTFQVKLPYNFVFGTLANNRGIGDISLAATANLYASEKWQLNATLGGKIPTGSADPKTTREMRDSTGVKTVSLPLPMYYSPTLGTFDFVAGISLSTKSWLFATGCQWALQSYGGSNEFLWGKWRTTSPEESKFTDVYPRANQLQRGFDVMGRVEKNLRFSNWNVYAGLLGIYRLTHDTFIAPNGTRIKAEGSTGLALTILVGGGYRFSTHSAIKILIGRQIHKREFNPDGLSREWVSTLGYEYRF